MLVAATVYRLLRFRTVDRHKRFRYEIGGCRFDRPWRPASTKKAKGMQDSKAHWLSIRSKLDDFDVHLGRATAQGYVHDPRMICFIASRYKFVSKMLTDVELALGGGLR